MKRTFAAAMALALTFAGAQAALAQPGHDDHHDNGKPGYVEHKEWHKGGRIAQQDWSRGQPVDYHAHHLRRPPHGYEWRQVDGNYVLAAAATGLIASMLVSH